MSTTRDMSRNAGNDENGKFDDISPKTKIEANELKTRVHQQSGEFNECSKFGKYGEFDDILPKNKMQANELNTMVPTKRRIQRIRRIWQIR